MQSDISTAGAHQDRRRTVEELERELAEAHRREAATAEVLKVIGRSPTNLQPVFDGILRSAIELCEAHLGLLNLYDGNKLRTVAQRGGNPGFAKWVFDREAFQPEAEVVLRVLAEGRPFQTADFTVSQAAAGPNATKFAELGGVRTFLAVPLLRDGKPIGNIGIYRPEVRPFTEQQIRLVNTFADQAVIAIENTRLFEEVQARTRELTESLEYQTAISEVLGVISRSPTDVQPVFDTIARSALHLCGGTFSSVLRFDGHLIHFVAAHGMTSEGFEALRSTYPLPPGRAGATTRAIETGALAEIPDVDADPHFQHGHVAGAQNFKSLASVPMLKDGRPIGTITVGQATTGRFPQRQIDLLKTFADQAVIAIENTRLFEAEQASKREMRDALEYQTATSHVLGVISRSPHELQPVLDAITKTAAQLCEADYAHFRILRQGAYHVAANHGHDEGTLARMIETPILPGVDSVAGRAALECATVHITNIMDNPTGAYSMQINPRSHSALGVPLLKDGIASGVIVLFRKKVLPFTDRQIELVKTFADQALIAIENTRLFEEVQERTRELQESLEYQTATSDVLNVISRSPNELQPVLDAIVSTARVLCQAENAFVMRLDPSDGKYHGVAVSSDSPEMIAHVKAHPALPGRGSISGRAGIERRPVHIVDTLSDPELIYADSAVEPSRTRLGVPLLKDGEVIGVIVVNRRVVRAFSERQISLITTFADQAVIAINNVGLFDEVQARNRDLTALGEVGRAISSTLDLKLVLKTIVDRAVELSGTDGGSIFYYRDQVGRFELGETTGLDEEVVARFRKLDISTGETGLGEAIAKRQPLQVPDILKRASNPLRDAALEAGLRAALVVPLLGAEGPLGALVLQRRLPGEFPEAVVSLMQTFADQSAIALENAHLFEEIAQKGRELEIASQHKSQFVANMSHELRTPLAAILGYAELMQEGFYGTPSDKSMDALTRIRSNGKHLLGLINTVLDIAKIESGQFSLNLAEYALDSMVETVRVATESLAETKKLSLKTDVGNKLPIGLGDEQRLTQVLLNLVGNAIKFTDTGEVRINASAVNGRFTVAVTDTGPGIPAEELKRVFEQFHQVDSSNTKAKGGTGLGLAIAKQIVEMHGGRIWVESTLGKGATFQMELPIRAESRKAT